MIEIRVDGRRHRVVAGRNLLDVLDEAGYDLPAMCHHRDLPVVGSCRLCLVRVEGEDHDVPACTLTTRTGLQVHTTGERLAAVRRDNLEMLARDYHRGDHLDASEFDRLIAAHAVPAGLDAPRYPTDGDPHPAIRVDMNRCILCTRCVRACNDIQGRFIWGVAGRSEGTRVVAGLDETMLEAGCESCGACVAWCPTGALTDRGAGRAASARRVATTCSYCGVGCGFDLQIEDDRIVGVASSPAAAVNGLHLCVKGRYGYDFVNHPDRASRPLVRAYLLEGRRRPAGGRDHWVETDWETALDLSARRFAAVVAESGADACAVMASAKCTNEENYLMQKFARQVLGTHSVDHCARLCHSSTVAGLKAALGSGAMTNTLDDVAHDAAAVFVIGSNTTEQHPVFGTMLRQAARRGVPLVVADPRRIELTEFATLHLQHRPGTDVALVNGLMHEMLVNGWCDEAFIAARTEGFDAVRAVVETYPPERVAEITGVDAASIREAARILGAHRPMAVVWAMGITQHICGVANVFALANLQLMLGNYGVPGSGVNPLRGQNNVQGACDMGCLPNVFPGYQGTTDPAALERFAGAWALDDEPCTFSRQAGLTVTEMIDGCGSGSVRALYLLGENVAMSDPDLNHVHAALERSEFVVLQEIFPSETARFADVLLPATSFAEKSGTYTNTERRIQLVRPGIAPPGDARDDWWITSQLAARTLAALDKTPSGAAAGWGYASAAAVMDEIAALTPSYGGVSHARLDRGDALHWPVPSADHPGTPILHVDRFTSGRGVFHAVEHQPPDELPSTDYPLCLTTGRVLYHWHGAEMTRRSATLDALCPEAVVEISGFDAQAAGISAGSAVRVSSRRGEMVARAWITERVPPGLVFGNFHFPGIHNINNLTNPALDPTAKIPEYKVCAVRIASAPADALA